MQSKYEGYPAAVERWNREVSPFACNNLMNEAELMYYEALDRRDAKLERDLEGVETVHADHSENIRVLESPAENK
jgi:hypothetical protein